MRVLLLPLGIFALAGAGGPALLCGGVGLWLWAWRQGAGPALRRAWWRSRWLVFTVFTVYLTTTPGEPWLAQWPGFSRAGVGLGVQRGLWLLDTVALVTVCLQALTPPVLAAAVVQLLRPLQRLRLPVQRLAWVLALTLDEAGQRLDALRLSPRQAAQVLAQQILHIEQRAQEAAPLPALPGLPPLPWAQAAVLLLLAVALAGFVVTGHWGR